MNIFMTGASGFIGSRLAMKLVEENHNITILLRDPLKGREFRNTGIRIIYGDVSDREILKSGMKNCDWIFHLAAYTKPVSVDPELPFNTNFNGTRNVLEVAKEQSVKKVIVTSTAGTLGYSSDGNPVNETGGEKVTCHTEYERTKASAEKFALDYNSSGLEVVVVNPTRVYGPGKLTVSNSVTRLIKMYGKGLWRIIPGDGNSIGNYVFIDDVINGHILAAVNGKGGEKYILGGENISYIDFFKTLENIYGQKRLLIKLSESSLKRLVKILGVWSKLTGKPQIISAEWIDKYLRNWIVSSDKARQQLGYVFTPFEHGAIKTVNWLRSVKK